MKKIALLVSAILFSSCTSTFNYTSPSGQQFDSTVTIIIPVEESKK